LTNHHDVAGHQHSISSLAFSLDGGRILSGSFDGTAKLWNLEDGSLLHDFSWGAAEIEDAIWSPDGKQIILAGSPPLVYSQAGDCKLAIESASEVPQGEVRVYDANHGELVSSFPCDATGISVSHCGKKLIALYLNQISVLELATGKLIAQIEIEKQTFVAAFNPVQSDIVICIAESSVWFCDLNSLKVQRISTEEKRLREFQTLVDDLDLGDVVLDTGCDGAMPTTPEWLPSCWSTIWNEKFSVPDVWRLSGLCDQMDFSVSNDNQRFAVADTGSWPDPAGVTVFRKANGEREYTFESPDGQWLRVSSLSPSGKLLAAAGDAQKVFVWDLQSQKMISIGQPPASVDHMVIAPDLNKAAVGNGDGSVGLIDLARRVTLPVTDSHPSQVVHMEYTLDADSLLVAWADGTMRVLSGLDLTTRSELAFPKQYLVGGMVLPDGEHFIGFGYNTGERRSLRSESELVLLSLVTGEILDSLPWSDDLRIRSVAASPDRSCIAVASGTSIWFVRYDQGFVVEAFCGCSEARNAFYLSVDFFPDGKSLLVSNEGYGVAILDLVSINEAGTPTSEFDAIRDGPTSNAINASGTRLARSTAYYSDIELFDLDTLKVKQLLFGHQNRVNSLLIWQDRTVISGGKDGTIKFWDIETGALIDSILATPS